ncbi:MAG: STAS domain-containing protein [Verrucomicrobiota bacterium]
MTITQENRNGIHLLRAHGKLLLGEGTTTLHNAVQTLVQEKAAVLVALDLSEVPYIDSAGLGTLVSAYTSVTSHGGQLVLVRPTKKIDDLLQVTKLHTVFQIFATAEEAVTALSSAGV